MSLESLLTVLLASFNGVNDYGYPTRYRVGSVEGVRAVARNAKDAGLLTDEEYRQINNVCEEATRFARLDDDD